MPPPPTKAGLNPPLLLAQPHALPSTLRGHDPPEQRPRCLSSSTPRTDVSAAATSSSNQIAALLALCSHGQLEEALWVLEPAVGPPDEDAYVALFHLCGELGMALLRWSRVGARAARGSVRGRARLGATA
ncbi:hypothetical protein ACP70R_001753 [Stipagrostis hirtigluma subsp. patula]